VIAGKGHLASVAVPHCHSPRRLCAHKCTHEIPRRRQKRRKSLVTMGFFLAEDGGFELPHVSLHVEAHYDIFPHLRPSKGAVHSRKYTLRHLDASKCTHKCTHQMARIAESDERLRRLHNLGAFSTSLRLWPGWAASSPAPCGQKWK
jgi:hypothetical protein